MNPKLFLCACAFLLVAFLLIAIAPGHAQQSGPSPGAAAGQQLPAIEGKWVLTYDYPAGVHKTRIFTFERDDKGKLTGVQNEPECPCDFVVSFKGDKLRVKLTPHKPTRIANPNALPPGAILGDPVSILFEAKVSGDTMTGKFYGENVLGESIKFTGVRQNKIELPANTGKS